MAWCTSIIALKGDVSKRARFALCWSFQTTWTGFWNCPKKTGSRGLMFLDDVVRAGFAPALFATFQPEAVSLPMRSR